MHIDEVEFANFQPHSLTTLSFSKHLNVITGRTHSGKSSLVRGMKWAFQNRPRGDNFRRDNTPSGDSTSVSVSFSEGTFITREKNPKKSLNAYHSSESDEPFVALRQDTPEEILQVTKMGKENLMSQGDGYFLIGKTPGQVAKELNKVVGLEIIDSKAAKAKRAAAKSSARTTFIDEQIESKQNNLSTEFEGLDEIISDSELLTSRITSCKEDKATITSISSIISSIDREQEAIEESLAVMSLVKDLTLVRQRLKLSSDKRQRIDNVSRLMSSISNLERKVNEEKEIISLSDETKELWNSVFRIAERRLKLSKVERLYRSIAKERSSKEGASKLENECVLKRDELKESLKELQSYCQVCGSDKEHWNLGRIK